MLLLEWKSQENCEGINVEEEFFGAEFFYGVAELGGCRSDP